MRRRTTRALSASAGVLAVVLALTVSPSAGAVSDGGSVDPLVEVVPLTAAGWESRAAEIVAGMSVRERAATVVMGHIPGTDRDGLRDYMAATGIGGFLLMGANVPADEAGLRRLTAALTVDAALPPLLAIDEEGGVVTRLPWDRFEGARTLATQPSEVTGDAFRGRAALLQRAGVSVNFGIVADVTADSGSFIFSRVLGTRPESAAARVAAAVEAEHGQVLSTLKHFPGHGAAPGDSHRGIPSSSMSLEQWRSREAVPFEAGIERGAELVMTGHLAYTAVDRRPASLSAPWYEILRGDLGFEGVAVTDDLGMLEASGVRAYADPARTAVAALAAGADMVLVVVGSEPRTAGRLVDAIETAVADGSLETERLDEAARRVIALRLQTAASGSGLLP